MTGSSKQLTLLQQLLDLHDIDQEIRALEREREQLTAERAEMEDGVSGLEGRLERLDTELEQARMEARRSERATDDKRDALDRLRGRVSQVQNEKQYSAASLEFDLVRQDLRKLEDLVLEKLQAVEDIEGRRNETLAELEEASTGAGPRRDEIGERLKHIEEALLIKQDRRYNVSIRLDPGALALYDRIRAGRSEVAVAMLTEEAVCGHCFTSVTIQQEMQIREMQDLICCEGCGVILYPRDFTR